MTEYLPLSDVTIVDLSWVIAGPCATQMFNQLGAEVIRVESNRNFDVTRPDAARDPDADFLQEGGWLFQQLNSGKMDISINLKTDKGREAFEALVKQADIVVCNYSTTAFKKLRLTYEELSAVNPQIIVLNASGMGYTGPYSDFVMYAPPLQAISGIARCVGYEGDRAPYEEYMPLTDYIGSLMIANLLMAAIEYRRRTGEGQFIDLSQCEGAVSFLGTIILDHQVNECNHDLIGNHHYAGSAAPHNTYPCMGDAAWCAISIAAEDEWQRFCRVVDPDGAWSADARFASLEQRVQHQELLDSYVSAWTRNHTPQEVGARLQANHVSAVPVQSRMDFLYRDEHIHARKFLVEQDLLITEKTPNTFLLQQPVARFTAQPMGGHPAPAPAVGEHTEHILKTKLHKSDAWIAEGYAEGAF